MKKLNLLVLLTGIFALSCSSNTPTTYMEKYKTKRETSAIPDSNFKNGFVLMSPETTDAHAECAIDYNGKAETDCQITSESYPYNAYWSMCQWWTPYNFKDATYSYSKEEKIHKYENESRLLEVNTETGSLRMRLDSGLEYQTKFGGPRPANETWSPFLIQTNFYEDGKLKPSSLSIDNGDGINFSFDITIDEATYTGEGTPTGNSCAQLFFYTILTNLPEDTTHPEEVGNYGEAMWFGVPIFDTRYKTTPAYKSADSGFEGATNKLIYNLPSSYYMPKDGVQFGTTYHIDFNVIEYLQEAFIYGAENGFMKNCLWQNLYMTYMNFGWELPGQYVVDSTISNLDIYISHNN